TPCMGKTCLRFGASNFISQGKAMNREFRVLAAIVLAVATTPLALAENVRMYTPESFEIFPEQFKAAPVIRAGDYVYISGMVAGLPNGVEANSDNLTKATRALFQRIGVLLEAAGANWSDVVDMTSYHVNMRESQAVVAAVRSEFVKEPPYPAWTGVGVEKLWADPLFLEVKVTAYVGED
ncbi:MAG: Rid family hydrolase, partial [Pseudomonadota bacterium]